MPVSANSQGKVVDLHPTGTGTVYPPLPPERARRNIHSVRTEARSRSFPARRTDPLVPEAPLPSCGLVPRLGNALLLPEVSLPPLASASRTIVALSFPVRQASLDLFACGIPRRLPSLPRSPNDHPLFGHFSSPCLTLFAPKASRSRGKGR